MPRPRKIVPQPGVTSPADSSFHELLDLVAEHLGQPPPVGLVIALGQWCIKKNGTNGNGNHTAPASTLFGAHEENGNA